MEDTLVKKQNRRANKIGKYFLWLIALFFAWVFLAAIFPGQIGSSDGVHTGTVIAVEHNSNIIWGSNIVYFNTTRTFSQVDQYCVNDENVKNQLIEAQKNKREVTIYYKNDYIMWKWQCNGGETIIYKAEQF